MKSKSVFVKDQLAGAMIWTFLLSIIECVASYLDVLGARSGYLFIKEISVGLGAGITVGLNRYLPPIYGSAATGLVGIVAIAVAVFLLQVDLRAPVTKAKVLV